MSTSFIGLGQARFGRRAACTIVLLLCAVIGEAQTSGRATATVLDTGTFARMSDRELRLAVLTKLKSLEARIGRESGVIQRQFGIAAAPPSVSPGANATVQVSACLQEEFAGDGDVEAGLELQAGAEGHLGLDAYGSGGKAKVRGAAGAKTVVVPAGGAKITVQVCGQATGDLSASSTRISTERGVMAVAAPGPAALLIQNLMQSISSDLLASAVMKLGMDGSRLGSVMNAMSNFSLSDVQFGKGPAASLLAALPLPTDVANLLRNPEDILLKATEGVQFAVNKLCGQTLFTGEVAQKTQMACSLRNQLPSGQTLVGILQGVKALP